MNLTKLLSSIKTFEDFISVSRNISDTSQVINLKFNTSTLTIIKKLIKFEIEYFNKYDENGAAFVVFREVLQMSHSPMMALLLEDTISVISNFLEAIRNDDLLPSADKKWKFLDKLIKIIMIFCEKNVTVHTQLSRHISEPLLSLATSKLFNYEQIVKIMKCFNAFSVCCTKEIRKQKFQKLNTYFTQLAYYIVDCKEYYGQFAILYALMKWFVDRDNCRKRAMIAKEWFPSHLFDEAAVQLFSEASAMPFTKFAREFLNTQNKVTKSIVSVRCAKVLMGNNLLVSGEEKDVWLDLSIRSKRLVVMSNDDETLSIDQENISVVEFKRHPDYILSIQLNEPAEILIKRAEHLQGALNVTIFITPIGDMAVFSDTLKYIVREKLKSPSDLVQPQQRRVYGKGILYFRPPVVINAPSSVSPTSVQQLPSIKLPDVKELSQRNTACNIDDRENDNRLCVETVASKLCRPDILNNVEENKGDTSTNFLGETIFNQLIGKVLTDNILKETNKDKNGNNVQKSPKTNKVDSETNVNGFHLVEESNSNSAISAAHNGYVNNETDVKKSQMKTTNGKDISIKPLNAADIEAYFSQHYRSDSDAAISPTLAYRLNRSSSNSVILESLGDNHELIQTSDLISPNQKTSTTQTTNQNLKTPIFNSELDVKMKKCSDRKGSPVQNNKNKTVALEREKSPDSPKATVEKGENVKNTNNGAVPVLNLNNSQNSRTTDSEKENGTSVVKNRGKRKATLASLKLRPKHDWKMNKTSNRNKKRRTLFSNELLQEEDMQQNEDKKQLAKDLTTQNVVETIISQNETKKISTSIYDQIEIEKPKRQIRKSRLRTPKVTGRSPVVLSPRSKKMDVMFENVKNGVDVNPIPTKNIVQDTKDTAIYNYSSESDNCCQIDTSVKSAVKTLKNNNRGRPQTKKKLFTEQTKKTQAKKKIIRKGKLKFLENTATNKMSDDVLIDETVRKANVDNVVDTSVILENVDTEQFVETSLPKLNKTSVMELMSESPHTKLVNKCSSRAYKAAKINTKSKKKEKSEQIRKEPTGNKKKQAIEKRESPIPELVIETVSIHENVKDSSLLTHLSSKVKGICKKTNEVTEDITESALHITDNENIHHVAPLEDVVHLGDKKIKTASILSPRVELVRIEKKIEISSSYGDKSEKTKTPLKQSVHLGPKKIKAASKLSPRVELDRTNVFEISSSHGDRSERTIDTLKTNSAIDAHGDSEEFPPNVSVLSRKDTPRDLETEELNTEEKIYYTNLAAKLNAVYDKNLFNIGIRSDESVQKERSSSGSFEYINQLQPRVIVERLPKRVTAEFSTSKITLQSLPVQYLKSPKMKESQLQARQTTHNKNDSNIEKKSSLRTSSPKNQNHDVLFDLRRLAGKVSPIKNILLENSAHINSPHESVTKKTRRTGDIDCKNLVNLSTKLKDMKLPVLDTKRMSQHFFHLRSRRETSDSENDEQNTDHEKKSVTCETETMLKSHTRDRGKLDKIDTTGSQLKNDLNNMFNHLLQVATADCGNDNRGLEEIRKPNEDIEQNLEKNLSSVDESRSNNMSVNYATKASEYNFRKRMVENESNHLGVKRPKILSIKSDESISTVGQWIDNGSRCPTLDKESTKQKWDDFVLNVLERFNTTMEEANRETGRRFQSDSIAYTKEVEKCTQKRMKMVVQWLEEWKEENINIRKNYLKANAETIIHDAKMRQRVISLVKEDLEKLRRDIAAVMTVVNSLQPALEQREDLKYNMIGEDMNECLRATVKSNIETELGFDKQ